MTFDGTGRRESEVRDWLFISATVAKTRSWNISIMVTLHEMLRFSAPTMLETVSILTHGGFHHDSILTEDAYYLVGYAGSCSTRSEPSASADPSQLLRHVTGDVNFKF